MIKAFVFGKFLPFHKGHEAMINFALTKCDFLSVLICCSEKESVPANIRKNWIEMAFEKVNTIEIRTFNYLEKELPNTSESSQEASKIWSAKFNEFFPDYDLVITSEEYGSYVASYMGIKHLSFDIPRQLFPVSATAVRNDVFANWNYLPESVKHNFAIKIVILGTESTGKTTLTERLAHYFQCASVKEAGRDLIADSNSFEFADLQLVAEEHAKRIDNAILGQSPLLMIDTDIHITKSYAHFIFEKTLEVDPKIYNSSKADLYLYLNNDVQYVQDGTRLSENDRNLLDISHRQTLRDHNIKFVEINGDWEQRFNSAIKEINLVQKNKNHSFNNKTNCMEISQHNLEQILTLIKSNYRKNLKVGIVLLAVGIVGIVYGSPTGGGDKGIFFGAGILSAVIGLILVLISLKDPSKHKLVSWLKTNPHEIVWMYEISGKQNGVRLMKENGDHVFLEITGPNKESWLNFIHKMLPNAHFGYDEIGKSRIQKK